MIALYLEIASDIDPHAGVQRQPSNCTREESL